VRSRGQDTQLSGRRASLWREVVEVVGSGGGVQVPVVDEDRGERTDLPRRAHGPAAASARTCRAERTDLNNIA
jgi:hypothetical protein